MFLLDTDISIYQLNGHPGVRRRVTELVYAPKAISVITFGELLYGAYKSELVERNLARVRQAVTAFSMIDINPDVIEAYGRIKARLEKQGTRLAEPYILIAATALHVGFTLVTNNEGHFHRIAELKIENWTQ